MQVLGMKKVHQRQEESLILYENSPQKNLAPDFIKPMG